MRTRRNHGNLFIANLPPNLPEARLAEAFDPYGIVLSAEIARDPNTGVRLRHGWIDIATERAATAAIAGLHGTNLDGSRIEVRPSEKPVRKPGMSTGPARRPPPRRVAPPAAATTQTGAAPPPAVERAPPQFVVERRPLRRRVEPPPRD